MLFIKFGHTLAYVWFMPMLGGGLRSVTLSEIIEEIGTQTPG